MEYPKSYRREKEIERSAGEIEEYVIRLINNNVR